MKATGIIRRIDDLGRIVIPKEIRKTMHIRESDPLEIFTERDGDIILKEYSRSVNWETVRSYMQNQMLLRFHIRSVFVIKTV